MAMTKTHFINLGNVIRRLKPAGYTEDSISAHNVLWREIRDNVADFCGEQNPSFDRGMWLKHVDVAHIEDRRPCGIVGCTCHMAHAHGVTVPKDNAC